MADEDAAYRSFLLEMGGGEDEVRRALGMADAPVTHYREDPESEEEAEQKEASSEKKKAKKEKKKAAAKDKEARQQERHAKRVQADEDF